MSQPDTLVHSGLHTRINSVCPKPLTFLPFLPQALGPFLLSGLCNELYTVQHLFPVCEETDVMISAEIQKGFVLASVTY